jgi:hypothetical protein
VLAAILAIVFGTVTANTVTASALPTSAAAGFVTGTTWDWAYRPLPATPGTTQTVQARLSGAVSADRNGGLVLRRSGPGRFLLVNFSGTTLQLFLASGGRMSLVYSKALRGTATAVIRADVSGSTVRAFRNGVLVASHTLPALRGYLGRGTALAIWQDRARAVSLGSATSSSRPAPKAPPAMVRPPTPRPAQPAGSGAARAQAGLKSGAAGDGAANGRFGAWRGRPITVGGTWNDTYEAQTQQWSVQRGAEWGSWRGDLDVAVGAIYTPRGESWKAAAAGAYDARWRKALTALKAGWGTRPGTLHIRFAHEFNGDWVPWAVRGNQTGDFITAWKRFRALQKQILPKHKLVFCPNDGSSSSLSLDWRQAFPGRAAVDEMAVDSYNQYPFVKTPAQFAAKVSARDAYGAPLGIERHRQFAKSVGRPLAIAEWSSNAGMGDGAVYLNEFSRWLRANAGKGPGQVPYEILFNVGDFGTGQFGLYPRTAQPKATAAYARLW